LYREFTGLDVFNGTHYCAISSYGLPVIYSFVSPGTANYRIRNNFGGWDTATFQCNLTATGMSMVKTAGAASILNPTGFGEAVGQIDDTSCPSYSNTGRSWPFGGMGEASPPLLEASGIGFSGVYV
jgi:hypothetical protein